MGAEKYRFACVFWLGFNIMCGVSCDSFKLVVVFFFFFLAQSMNYTDSIKVGFVCDSSVNIKNGSTSLGYFFDIVLMERD